MMFWMTRFDCFDRICFSSNVLFFTCPAIKTPLLSYIIAIKTAKFLKKDENINRGSSLTALVTFVDTDGSFPPCFSLRFLSFLST